MSGVPTSHPTVKDHRTRPDPRPVLFLRIRLSRIYDSLSLLYSSSDSKLNVPLYTRADPLGFDASSIASLPSRIILVGAAVNNPAVVSLPSTILVAPISVRS